MVKVRGLVDRIPPAGTKVRLTAYFLQNTGQFTGPEGLSRWTTIACDCSACKTGHFIAVNEPHHSIADPRGYEDVPVEKRPKWRHFAAGNLEIVGAPPRANNYP